MFKIRLATDVGGTFTDLVYYEVDKATGQITSFDSVKTHTTPPHFERGVQDAVDKANIRNEDIEFFAHGTTVVINALTERKGVKTALITTKGFRDVLEIARGNRPDFFNLRYQKPEPFVPRYLRQEITERLTYKGEVLIPLSLEGLDDILANFKAEGVEAIAVCLLHSYANPDHEKQLMLAINERWPEISVVASHQISREWREYERTTPTKKNYIINLPYTFIFHNESKSSNKTIVSYRSLCNIVARFHSIPPTGLNSQKYSVLMYSHILV